MKIGTAVRMTGCTIHEDLGYATASFKFVAPKGQRFVFLLLGAEPKDGSEPLNPRALLEEWGWTPPPAENGPSDMAAAGGLPPLSATDTPLNPIPFDQGNSSSSVQIEPPIGLAHKAEG